MFAIGSVRASVSIGLHYAIKREALPWYCCLILKESNLSSLLGTISSPNCVTFMHYRSEASAPLVEAPREASPTYLLWAQKLNPLACNCVLRNWEYKGYMSSSSVELKTENDVVRFSIGKNHSPEKGRNPTRRVKMSRKAKLNELRFYRLKARKKMNSPDPEVRIIYKLEKAKRKEAWLIEKLRKFEAPKIPAETYDPEMLTEEEKHYLKRTGEKKKNFILVGRRGVFGGVVLNMHLHWKKHETVKIICKPCKPGQIHEYAQELARLSKGIVIDIKPNNSIIFYRGKNYVQPQVMSPPDTLSKYKALEKYKYGQSLEHTSQFIEKLEKELEEYHEHVARYKNRKEDATVADA